MGRTHRLLGLAAMIAGLVAVPGSRAEAPRTAGFPPSLRADLSPQACRRDLRHAAVGTRSIEGRSAGAYGGLAHRVLYPAGLPDPGGPPAGPGFVSRTLDPAPRRPGSVSGPPRRAPSRAGEVFSTSAILAISDARVYPNPFNPAFRNTTIAFGLSKDAQVEITAYDWAGAFVDRVFKGVGTAGANAVEWGGQTEDGRKLGNGVYLIRIVASTDARTESQVLKAVVWNEG